MKDQGRRRGRLGVAVVAAGALLLGACGTPGAKLTPQQSVGKALGAEFNQSGVSLQVSIGLDGAQILQLAHATGGPDVTQSEANALAGTSIVVKLVGGHGESIQSTQFATDTANQLDLALLVNKSSSLELRYTGKTIYVRADLTTAIKEFGVSTSEAGTISRWLDQANQYLPGLSALGHGQWVAVPLASIESLLHQFQSSGSASVPTANTSQIAKAEQQLKTIFTGNATYAFEGTHGGRAEYAVTVQVHNALQKLAQALSGVIPTAGVGALDPSKMISGIVDKVPADQTVVLQMWVSNGKAQEVDLDVRQFDTSLPFAVPVRFVLGSASSIPAPTGATTLDLSKLPQILGQLFEGLLGGGIHASHVTPSTLQTGI